MCSSDLLVGLFCVTNRAPSFTLAAHDVYAPTGDAAVHGPDCFEAGALDFASSIFAWVIFHLTHTYKVVGPLILSGVALAMMYYNRRIIVRESQGDVETPESKDIEGAAETQK